MARCTAVMFMFCEGTPPAASGGVVSSLTQISTGSLASTVESACHATVEIASQFINRTHCVLTHITTSQPLKQLRGYRLCVQHLKAASPVLAKGNGWCICGRGRGTYFNKFL